MHVSKEMEVGIDTWKSVAANYPCMMFRVDLNDAKQVGGFVFPAEDKPYFTGAGGLHFWADIDDAVAYAVDDICVDHIYACPMIDGALVVHWTRELMAQQKTHTKPTLVLGVTGYNGARRMRNEVVLPGVKGSVYAPSTIIRIIIASSN